MSVTQLMDALQRREAVAIDRHRQMVVMSITQNANYNPDAHADLIAGLGFSRNDLEHHYQCATNVIEIQRLESEAAAAEAKKPELAKAVENADDAFASYEIELRKLDREGKADHRARGKLLSCEDDLKAAKAAFEAQILRIRTLREDAMALRGSIDSTCSLPSPLNFVVSRDAWKLSKYGIDPRKSV